MCKVVMLIGFIIVKGSARYRVYGGDRMSMYALSLDMWHIILVYEESSLPLLLRDSSLRACLSFYEYRYR